MSARSLSSSLLILLTAVVMLAVPTTAHAQRKATLRSGNDQAPGFDVTGWYGEGERGIKAGATNVVLFLEWDDSDPVKTYQTVLDFIVTLASYEIAMQERLVWNDYHVLIVITGNTEDRHAQDLAEGTDFLYAVDRRGGTKRKWIDAADVPMPCGFIVDPEGRVQHWAPFFLNTRTEDFMDQFGEITEKISLGRYDRNLMREAQPLEQSLKTARRTRNWRQVDKLIDEMLEKDRRVFAEKHLLRFETMIVDRKDKELAGEYARKVMAEYTDDPWLLAELARKIATDPKIEDDLRDLDLALELAKASAQGMTRETALKYSVPAEIHFARGEIREAIMLQRKAFRISATGFLKERMKFKLDRYAEARRDQKRTSTDRE